MATNYGLGRELTQEEDEALWEYRAEHGISFAGRRMAEYFFIREKSINDSKDSNLTDRAEGEIHKRIAAAYPHEDNDCIYVDPGYFITDDVELFLEFYEKLSMDFVHDFRTGLFFLDMFGGHEALMGQLYNISSNNKNRVVRSKDAAEEYVVKGLGMYKSSQSPNVWLGEDVAIPDFFRPHKHRIKRM